jgi:hypothetical protein
VATGAAAGDAGDRAPHLQGARRRPATWGRDPSRSERDRLCRGSKRRDQISLRWESKSQHWQLVRFNERTSRGEILAQFTHRWRHASQMRPKACFESRHGGAAKNARKRSQGAYPNCRVLVSVLLALRTVAGRISNVANSLARLLCSANSHRLRSSGSR